MNYPYEINLNIEKVYGTQDVSIKLNSAFTTFIGANGSGKTQTLKEIRNYFRNVDFHNVRYLSSNRIGTMENYRSRTSKYDFYRADEYVFGDSEDKVVRSEIETAAGDFFAMDERKDIYIKVEERLSTFFQRNIFIRWNDGKMQVFFCKKGDDNEYSIAFEASGLINVVSILAAIFDEKIEVLLIDEPEVSLHPQLQSFLLREMKIAAERFNKTIIISTHSAKMIELNKADDICNFVFFENNELPKQVSLENPQLKSQKIKDFILRMGLIHNEAFFAKKIMLIEGVSDMIICKHLCNKLNLNLDVAGSQIIPIDGKGQFPTVSKLFRLIGKDICILTDLDGFIDDNSIINLFSTMPESKIVANKYGASDIISLANDIKNDLILNVNQCKDQMDSIYEQHYYWINRDKEDDKDKAIKRALIAELLSNDDVSDWFEYEKWESIKTRLIVLFDVLEELGCFVLRKGTIESYYDNNSCTNIKEKVSAASEEANNLYHKTNSQIESQYSDLIRCLKFAAVETPIKEFLAVKKELYSELGLITGILDENIDNKDIYSAIKNVKGKDESLFEYIIIKENGRIGVEVRLKYGIMDVKGFPFKVYKGENTNQVIDSNVFGF